MGLAFVILVLFVVGFVMAEKSGLLNEGEKAPDVEVRLCDGQTFRLKDMEGKNNVVLFFYPRDFTAGCTEQACSMRDGFGDLVSLHAVVFGISGDGCESHALFRSTYNLPFALIADTERVLINAFGVERLGGLVRMPKRMTYVIDKRGVIRLAAHHEFMMRRHLEDVLVILKTLEGINITEQGQTGRTR